MGLFSKKGKKGKSSRKAGDEKDAVEQAMPSEADAQRHLENGKAYYSGHGVPNDFAAAFEEFSKAAHGGLPEASFWLAVLYEHGRGVQQSMEKAVDMYRVAAESGIVGALINLGALYEGGDGVVKDEREALRLYLEAASLGSAVAQYNAAVMYSEGRGCPKDMGKAVQYFTMAANKGLLRACMELGEILEKGLGVKVNKRLALEMYEKAEEGKEEGAREKATVLRKEVERERASSGSSSDSQRHVDRSQSNLMREVLTARAAYRASRDDDEATEGSQRQEEKCSPQQIGSRSRAFGVLEGVSTDRVEKNCFPLPTSPPPPPSQAEMKSDAEKNGQVQPVGAEIEEKQVISQAKEEEEGLLTFSSGTEDEGQGEDGVKPSRRDPSLRVSAHETLEQDLEEFKASERETQLYQYNGVPDRIEDSADNASHGSAHAPLSPHFGSPEREHDYRRRGNELLEEGLSYLKQEDEAKALSRFLMAAQYGNTRAASLAEELQDQGLSKEEGQDDEEEDHGFEESKKEGRRDVTEEDEHSGAELFTDNDLNALSQDESDDEGDAAFPQPYSPVMQKRVAGLLRLWETGLRKHEKTVTSRNKDKREARERSRDRTLFQVLEEATALAAEGIAEAEVVLAEMFIIGVGREKNGEKAVQYLASAVSRGHSPAMIRLAKLLLGEGKRCGIHKDVKRALRLLRRLKSIEEEEALPEADVLLGTLYEEGGGVDANPRKAMEHYRTAADAGNAEGHYRLAVVLRSCLRRATGTSSQAGNSDSLIFTDRGAIARQEVEKEAFYHLKEAAAAGHMEACWLAGRMTEERVKFERKQDREVTPFSPSSSSMPLSPSSGSDKRPRLGRAQSAKELSRARALSSSSSIAPLTPMSKDEVNNLLHDCFAFFSTAADKGHRAAKAKIAQMLLRGEGAAVDAHRAFTVASTLEQEALKVQGLPEWLGEVYTVLGLCYKEGKGTFADDEKAVEYFHLGAGAGDIEAKLHLALMLRDGRGTAKDEARAASFLKIVAETGDPEAQYQLALLHLSGKGVAQSQNEAEKYLRLASDGGHEGALRTLSRLVKGTSREISSPSAASQRNKDGKLSRSPSARSLLQYRNASQDGRTSPSSSNRSRNAFSDVSDGESPRESEGGFGLRRERSVPSLRSSISPSSRTRGSPVAANSSNKVADNDREEAALKSSKSAEKKLLLEQRARRKAELEAMKLKKRSDELDEENRKLTGQVSRMKKKMESEAAAREKAEDDSVLAKLMARSSGDEKSRLQTSIEGLYGQLAQRDKRIEELEALVRRLQRVEGDLKDRSSHVDRMERLLEESEEQRRVLEDENQRAKLLAKKLKEVAEEAVTAKEAIEKELETTKATLEEERQSRQRVLARRPSFHGSRSSPGLNGSVRRKEYTNGGSASGLPEKSIGARGKRDVHSIDERLEAAEEELLEREKCSVTSSRLSSQPSPAAAVRSAPSRSGASTARSAVSPTTRRSSVSPTTRRPTSTAKLQSVEKKRSPASVASPASPSVRRSTQLTSRSTFSGRAALNALARSSSWKRF